MNTLANSCFQFQENDEASKECIRIMNERYEAIFEGKENFIYWISGGIADTFYKEESGYTKISPSDYLALLTGKQLTEGDLIVGNRFECIEDIINGREGVSFTKGEKYKCELDKSITNNFGYPQYTFKDSEYLNRHFKLLPTQESVKEIDTFIADHDKLSLKMANEEISHLQQQLNTLTSEIKRLQEKYDENGYDSPPTIQLQRIEQHVDSALGHWVQQLKEAKEFNEKLKDLFEKAISYLISANYYVSIQEEETLISPKQESLADRISDFIQTNS